MTQNATHRSALGGESAEIAATMAVYITMTSVGMYVTILSIAEVTEFIPTGCEPAPTRRP
ncbi:hypothetical protein GCM10023170_084490 [Phytohabitans houttuyneae]|uniref:Uncharacterized protein n=1 Tax=Phytohabitans houttuyneae TaxID=1076126 RepID=A0A6V8KI98_9ACTN|nr:hypothetical protein Phou_063080 [Phytohabitans houttuyneae]